MIVRLALELIQQFRPFSTFLLEFLVVCGNCNLAFRLSALVFRDLTLALLGTFVVGAAPLQLICDETRLLLHHEGALYLPLLYPIAAFVKESFGDIREVEFLRRVTPRLVRVIPTMCLEYVASRKVSLRGALDNVECKMVEQHALGIDAVEARW